VKTKFSFFHFAELYVCQAIYISISNCIRSIVSSK